MKSLEVTIDDSIQKGSPVYNTLLESLPYYLGEQYDVVVEPGKLSIAAVPEHLYDSITQAALEAVVAAKAEHERVDERCLHSFEGNLPLQEGVFEALVEQGGIYPTGFGKLLFIEFYLCLLIFRFP